MVSKDVIQNKTAALVRIIGMFPHLPDDWQAVYPPQGDAILWYVASYVSEKDTCAYNLLSMLADAGFGFVGSGCFGMVVRHDTCPDVVFKISARLNDAYGAFALYARDCAGNPHLPVIYDIQTGYGCMVVALEELQRVHWYDDLCGLHDAIGSTAYEGAIGNECPEFDGSPDYFDVVKCAYEIGCYFSGVASIDIHGENIMQRTDGTLVITDPVSYTRV